MEHSESSAAWNPALRSDDVEIETEPELDVPVATAITTEEAVEPEPPSLPTSQEPVPDAIEPSHTEPAAPLENEEASPPAVSDEHPAPAETREEFHEEAAELFSAAGGESEEADPFDREDVAGEDGLHAPQEDLVPEVQTQHIDHDIPDDVPQENPYPDAGWLNPHHEPDRPSSINGEVSSTNHDLWGSPKSVDNGEDRFFDQLKTQTKPIYFEPEESRYEEGLPLLDEAPETPVEPQAPQQSQLDGLFEGDEDEDDGFFSSAPKPEPADAPNGPFHIHRKSTSQVMDEILDSNPIAIASPLSPTAEDFDDILAAAASKSPEKVKEQASEEDLAAAWQAELSDDDLDVAPAEENAEDLAAKWQAELDDDDLLLENVDGTQDTSDMANGVADHAQGLGSPFGTPTSAGRPKPSQSASASAYTPHQPSTGDLVGVPVPGAPLGTSTPYNANFFPPKPAARAPLVRAESYAEQSKQGYKSPYDLPEDLAPRRRPAPKPVAPATAALPTAPPRSSSIPAPPPQTSSAIPPPMGAPNLSPKAAPPAPAPVPPPKNFYEELPLPPVQPRSRPSSSGRYAPNPNASPSLTQPPPPAQSGIMPPPPGVIPRPDLSQPDHLGPYANTMAPNSQSAPVVPSVNSRYSPKPPTLQPGSQPPPSSRYSPAPPPSAAPPPPQRYASQPAGFPGQALPFQPRTSSPLAHHEKVSYQPNDAPRKASLPQPLTPVDIHAPHIDSGIPISPRSAHLHPGAPPVGQATSAPSAYQPSSPPRNPYAPPSYIEEFSRRVTHGNNAPSPYAPPPPAENSPFVPPRRSQTQSPTHQQAAPRLSVPTIDPLKRPASVHAPSSPTKSANAYAPAQSSSHTRAISQSLEFIPPSDGQESDALQRWRGAPIFKFGFGGTVLSCFPKHIPRYSAGQTAPKIKSTPGEIKTGQLHDVLPFSTDTVVQHPGSLRNKSKKKDLIAWLSNKIAAFENDNVSVDPHDYSDSYKRREEKILLWKVVRVLVEHDGGAHSSPELQKSLRSVIFPHLQQADAPGSTFGDSIQSFAAEPLDSSAQSDTSGPKSLGPIHNNLLLGEREKAVWSAADGRLWGHAMIIASTLDKAIWKQVVQEFVRREVRSSGNAESLAALYEIFAGNFEESIDELVPPSARAGLQMVSRADGQGASKDALAGLESWKDTLGLVLSNRSPDDHQALLALGRLLLSYGRVEAAHICLIFSKAVVFGGPGDHQASIALLGVDHVHSSPSTLLDDDAILLTEAYEYATSVLAGSTTSTLPHLLAFKLLHAWSLVDQGRKSDAQQYCDALAASLKATTKPTGYHHQYLFFGVEELSARLKQTTGEGGSWISKPSMEKVSSSMWNRFSNFVAGDDSDAASTGSGKGAEGEFGPFAKIAGTPTVSRSPSVTDLYGQYPMPAAQPIPNAGLSRYQPSNQYAPNSSPDQGRGRSSLDSQRSASYGAAYGQRRESQEYTPQPQPENPMYAGGPFYGSPSAGYQSTPPQPSYMPLAPVDEDNVQQAYPSPTAGAHGIYGSGSPYQPSVNTFDQSFAAETAANSQANEADGYMPPASSFSYEPPSTSGAPALEVTEESDDEKPRKKAQIDDDDDDFAAQSEALKKAEKERKDKEADEAFRKAAEADAQKATPAKSSWWGWIKGGDKKEETNAAGKPIRAKLGEESSFYFDTDLKKWVNKKDPNSATPTRATPPPPKAMGPPSRTASGSSMPPPPVPPIPTGAGSRPPSSGGPPPPALSSSPASSSLGPPPTPALGPARSVSTGAVATTGDNSRPGSSAGPPPRPISSLSHASSIDDLLGAPQARKGAGSRGRKKGRYVDVMAQ